MKHLRAGLRFALPLVGLLLAACSAQTGLLIKADGSAVISAGFEIPAVVEQRLRALAGSESAITGGAFFDAEAVRLGMLRRGLVVNESRAPAARSYNGVFTASNLADFIRRDPDLSRSGVFSLEQGTGWQQLIITINKQNARNLVALFPGIDMQLLESLSPPALFDLPVSKADYRSMLAALLGRPAIEAMDASRFQLSIQLPGSILEASGGSIGSDGKSFSFSLPVLDAMVLEQPIVLRVRWRE
jgi:hypothetical protein